MSNNPPIGMPANAWNTLNLELIAFPETTPASMEQNWVAELTGTEGESLRKKGERIDTADCHGASLRMAADLLRIRFTIGAKVEVNAAEGFSGTPDLGSFSSALEWFKPLINRWLTEMCPPVARIAFCGKLVQWTSDRVAAYQTLSTYIPAVQIDTTCREFQYHLNRPRTSRHMQAMEINRLCTWSAIKVTLGATSEVAGREHTTKKDLYGAFLQLDINTSQDFVGTLPPDSLSELWSELTDFGVEIASLGDIQ